MPFIMITRFNNNTWDENVRWRENNNFKGCIYNSLYRCAICRNHVCINHKLGHTKDFLVCSECYVNDEYRDIIYTNGIHYYNKNKRCKYFQIFLNFISFEWTRNKVQHHY